MSKWPTPRTTGPPPRVFSPEDIAEIAEVHELPDLTDCPASGPPPLPHTSSTSLDSPQESYPDSSGDPAPHPLLNCLVQVRWLDIYSRHGFEDEDPEGPTVERWVSTPPAAIDSVGWLIHADHHCYIIAASKDAMSETSNYGDLTYLPAGCVTNIQNTVPMIED